jgi:Na+/glutamate symporter
MLIEWFLMWHCVDIANCKDGGDLSNIAATYIGIIAGFVLGGIISWWIYNRQEKTAIQQQEILDHIANLEEKHEDILEKHELILENIQKFEQNHDEMLNNILTLNKKIDSLLENK